MHNQLTTLENKITSLFPAVRRKALGYLRNADNADDVAQEVMIRLLRARAVPRRPSSAWLNVVVRNAAIDFLRRLRIEREYVDSRWTVDTVGLRYEDGELCCQPAVCERHIEPDIYTALEEAVAEMSKPMRQTLLLYASGYSYEQIAELTQVTIGTVRSRLHYIRKNLRSQLAAYR